MRLRYLQVFAIANPSVCRLFVCNVGAPYSGGWTFRQYFLTAVYAGHPLTSVQNFTEIVLGEPLRRRRYGGSKIERRWTYQRLYLKLYKIRPRVQLMAIYRKWHEEFTRVTFNDIDPSGTRISRSSEFSVINRTKYTTQRAYFVNRKTTGKKMVYVRNTENG